MRPSAPPATHPGGLQLDPVSVNLRLGHHEEYLTPRIAIFRRHGDEDAFMPISSGVQRAARMLGDEEPGHRTRPA